MGNLPSVPNVDYSRTNGRNPPAAPNYVVPYIKNLSPKELAQLFPYLEKQAQRMGEIVESNNAKDFWEKDYNTIKDGDGSPSLCSALDQNANLNRYRNIVAYDHNRVLVDKNQHNGNNDYINASWIPGYGQDKGYIASQGPVPGSMPAFWQMVFTENCRVIVMVTNEIEGNKLKCHRYWPTRESPTETYGLVQVTLVEEEVKGTYIHRRMELVCNGVTAHLDHYQYTVWPDHGVPNTTGEILSFRKEIRKKFPTGGSPMLVHCSAGVGRTGTFIVIDTMMARMERLENDLNIKNLVKTIRKSRNYLVQTLIQYHFCHRAILEMIEKSLVKCVRAVENKKDDIMKLQFDVVELEEDIGAALDDYGGEANAAALLQLGAQISKGVRADVRWTAFDGKRDKKVAAKVPTEVRTDSLQQAGNMWKIRGNVPFSAEEKGYARRTVTTLSDRVEALAISASPETWKARYAEVVATWVAEVYDVTASLNPLESRMMSLASQQENWKLRGAQYRKQIEKDSKEILHDLTTRLGSLSDTIQGAEGRWKDKGDGMRGEKVRDHREHTAEFGGAFMERVTRLVTFVDPNESKKRGTVEGKEVESPDKLKRNKRMQKEKEDAERMMTMKLQEADRLAKEKEARKKREAEAKRKAEKPVKGARTPNTSDASNQLADLSPTKKDEKLHPMVAGVQEMMGTGPKINKPRRKSKE